MNTITVTPEHVRHLFPSNEQLQGFLRFIDTMNGRETPLSTSEENFSSTFLDTMTELLNFRALNHPRRVADTERIPVLRAKQLGRTMIHIKRTSSCVNDVKAFTYDEIKHHVVEAVAIAYKKP